MADSRLEIGGSLPSAFAVNGVEDDVLIVSNRDSASNFESIRAEWEAGRFSDMLVAVPIPTAQQLSYGMITDTEVRGDETVAIQFPKRCFHHHLDEARAVVLVDVSETRLYRSVNGAGWTLALKTRCVWASTVASMISETNARRRNLLDTTSDVFYVNVTDTIQQYNASEANMFGAGNNAFYQLMTGTNARANYFTRTELSKKMTFVATTALTGFAITEDHITYATGANQFGQLGIGNETDHTQCETGSAESYDPYTCGFDIESEPVQVYMNQTDVITYVCASSFHTVFITDDGQAYSAGSTEHGKTGIGKYDNDTNLFTPIPVDTSNLEQNERFVSCTTDTLKTRFLTNFGNLYYTGYDNLFSVVDIPTKADVFNFAEPEEYVVSMSGISEHILFLTNKNRSYSYGSDSYGGLGVASDADASNYARLVDLPTDESVVRVSAGYEHSLFLLANGSVYASGKRHDHFNALCLGTDGDDVVYVPEQIPELNDVVDIRAGDWHTVIVTSELVTEIYTCGLNDHGQLSIEDPTQNAFVPTRTVRNFANITTVVQISGTSSNSVALEEMISESPCGDGVTAMLVNSSGTCESNNLQTLSSDECEAAFSASSLIYQNYLPFDSRGISELPLGCFYYYEQRHRRVPNVNFIRRS
ncbi:hypothetical protein CYMTET_31846 [Cymbomonas tetramitiformis]|uniref:Uncharacterized protein n=1 Tax=Cymbomonas tetramitiformis TaxID=36881 RepID=A0AAE0KSH6_9CHLO|nr:hypothetical protein CYMTET_31846 [Cymbomonas tetramitiformis]